jgi:hypothetical protein
MFKIAQRLAVVSVTLCLLGSAIAPWYLVYDGKVQARGVTIDATDFGAIGDGTNDDSAAFQRAIDVLELTGGSLYVPANRTYIVGDVEINSLYPIWIKSDMGNHVLAGAVSNTWAGRANIRPPAAGCGYIFKWERHASILTAGGGAGGGIEGLCISDIDTGAGTFHARAISTGAIWVDDGQAFTIDHCEFQWLLGSAVHVDESTYAKIHNSKFYYCGNLTSTKPVIDAGGEATQAYLWMTDNFIENSYYTHIICRSNSLLTLSGGYHENAGGTTSADFIDCSASFARISDTFLGGTTGVSITLGGTAGANITSYVQDCIIQASPTTGRTIWIQSNHHYARLSNLQIFTGGQTGPVIEVDSNNVTLNDIYTQGGGPIKIDGNSAMLTGIYCRQPSTAAASYQVDLLGTSAALNGCTIDGQASSVCHGIRANNSGQVANAEVYNLVNGNPFTDGAGLSTFANCRSYDNGTGIWVPTATTTLIGNYADAGTLHLPRQTEVLTVGLNDFRELSNGVAPTNATDPTLDDDAANNALSLTWSATNSDSIVVSLALPQGFDGSQDVTVTLAVSTDNSGGGGIDAATFTVVSTWANEPTPITDTATDASPSETLHNIIATILAADITDGATRLTLLLAPATHTNDPVRLHDVRVSVKRAIANP